MEPEMEHTDVADRNDTEQALTEVKGSFNALFENAPVMMHSLGTDGRLVKVNRLWLQTLGYELEDVQGRKPTDFLTEESRLWASKDTLPLFWRVGSARSIGYQFVKKEGQILDVLLDAELTTTGRGDSFALATLRDPHDQMQWEQASATMEALQSLARIQQGLEEKLSEGDSDPLYLLAVQDSLDQLCSTSLTYETRGTLLELARDLSANLLALIGAQGIQGGQAKQITSALESAQLLEEVRDGQEQLRLLSRRLVEAQEAERRHIALELHDEIGQMLTALRLTLDTRARLSTEERESNLYEAQKLVSDLLERVRDLSLDLRPPMLDDLGLLPTLLWFFGRYTDQTHVKVDFNHNISSERFPPRVEITAFRIVQESLTNVARHSGVDQATVRIRADQDVLRVEVQDQGRGFDPGTQLTSNIGIGIAGMRERARSLKGQLQVESAAGRGTRMTAALPLNDVDSGSRKEAME